MDTTIRATHYTHKNSPSDGKVECSDGDILLLPTQQDAIGWVSYLVRLVLLVILIISPSIGGFAPYVSFHVIAFLFKDFNDHL